MITKEEMDQIELLKEYIYNGMVAQKEDVDFLIKIKKEADSIKQECVAVLQMIRRR